MQGIQVRSVQGVGGGLKREGIRVHMQLIHDIVQQELTQYC